jgi:hypothetical protein
MAFCGKIYNYIGLFGKLMHESIVEDIPVRELKPRIVRAAGEVVEIAGVSEGIKYVDPIILVLLQDEPCKVAANEAGSAGYD